VSAAGGTGESPRADAELSGLVRDATSGAQLASAETESDPPTNDGDQIVLRQPLEVLPPVAEFAPAPLAVASAIPIDFASALAIAAGDNPQVGYSRQRINEAFAQLQAAEVLWVPSLRAGMNYNKHEGTIQDVAGRMIETSRGSVYTGLGAQAVGAGSPAVPGLIVNFHTKDAIFQPRIAGQLLGASRQANRATTNDILLETALAYNDLLEAYEVSAVADDTLANIQRLADVTADYARTGQGLPSDADRAQAELATRKVESQRAVESVQVASVRLARLLSQDPTINLLPQEAAIAPIDLAPMQCSLQDLVETSLSNRPELAESRFLVGAAVERLRRELNAPLIPSVLLGMSYGGNGGGLGDDISNFGDRMDFDAVAFWEVRNLGYGEQAARNQARSALEQARWRQVQVMDQVASDVAEAYAQVVSRREQIDLARTGIAAARDSYRRNSERTQEGVGLPIEALQAIQALDAAQRQYVRSIADYNRAQFRLQRALGWPVQ
jgi:outer membrane protein TolC